MCESLKVSTVSRTKKESDKATKRHDIFRKSAESAKGAKQNFKTATKRHSDTEKLL